MSKDPTFMLKIVNTRLINKILMLRYLQKNVEKSFLFSKNQFLEKSIV